jgi:hypothetical protein
MKLAGVHGGDFAVQSVGPALSPTATDGNIGRPRGRPGFMQSIVVYLATMAYVVPRRGDNWDIRESRLTAAGPRSYTLASFKTLTPEVIGVAQAKAAKPVDATELRRKAVRAGAPVEAPAPDRAAAELLAEIDAGRAPRAALRRLLLGALGAPSDIGERPGQVSMRRLDNGAAATSANARAAAAWIGATPKQRGDSLRELLLLTDRLPRRARPERERFPRIDSGGARTGHPVTP